MSEVPVMRKTPTLEARLPVLVLVLVLSGGDGEAHPLTLISELPGRIEPKLHCSKRGPWGPSAATH